MFRDRDLLRSAGGSFHLGFVEHRDLFGVRKNRFRLFALRPVDQLLKVGDPFLQIGDLFFQGDILIQKSPYIDLFLRCPDRFFCEKILLFHGFVPLVFGCFYGITNRPKSLQNP